MDVLYNHPRYKERRQELRNNMTLAERVLWEHLRARQFMGLKFRRQHGIDRFILDFYCPSLRLAIEVDGSVHEGVGAVRDQERDDIIKASNIQVVRFWNDEVLKDMDSVLRRLEQVCGDIYSRAAMPPSAGNTPSLPSPCTQGEGSRI